MFWKDLYEALSRKKPLDDDGDSESFNDTHSDGFYDSHNTNDARTDYTSDTGCKKRNTNFNGSFTQHEESAFNGNFAKHNSSGREEDFTTSSGRGENYASSGNYEKHDTPGGGNSKPRARHTSATSGSREKLTRVLGLLDLTFLGIGSTLGLGVYILGGAVAKNQAGPAVIVSLVLAAATSAFSGTCGTLFRLWIALNLRGKELIM